MYCSSAVLNELQNRPLDASAEPLIPKSMDCTHMGGLDRIESLLPVFPSTCPYAVEFFIHSCIIHNADSLSIPVCVLWHNRLCGLFEPKQQADWLTSGTCGQRTGKSETKIEIKVSKSTVNVIPVDDVMEWNDNFSSCLSARTHFWEVFHVCIVSEECSGGAVCAFCSSTCPFSPHLLGLLSCGNLGNLVSKGGRARETFFSQCAFSLLKNWVETSWTI